MIDYCITLNDLLATDPSLTIPNVQFMSTLLSQVQASGQTIGLPALKATWDAALNPYVTGIEFRYIPTSFTGEEKLSPRQPVSTAIGGTWSTTSGIVSEAVYDCWWRAVKIDGTPGDWVGPTSVTIDTQPTLQGNLAQFLWSLQPNLMRFDFWAPVNGTTVIDPFKNPPVTGAFGDQQMALSLPANVNGILAQWDPTGVYNFGLATVGNNGGMYNHDMLASVPTGTGTIRMRFVAQDLVTVIQGRFSTGGVMGALGDLDTSWALTTTPSQCPWDFIHSDDAAFPDAILQIYTQTGDLPNGGTATDLMLQNDNYFDKQGMETPWRPSPDEDNLARYGAHLYTLWRNILTIKKNYSMRTNPEGNGQRITPPGPANRHWISGNDTAGPQHFGSVMRLIDNGDQDITVPAKGTSPGDVWWNGSGVVTVRQVGTGLKRIVPGTGVLLNPPYGASLNVDGSFSLRGPGDSVQMHWAGETLSPGGGGEWDLY